VKGVDKDQAAVEDSVHIGDGWWPQRFAQTALRLSTLNQRPWSLGIWRTAEIWHLFWRDSFAEQGLDHSSHDSAAHRTALREETAPHLVRKHGSSAAAPYRPPEKASAEFELNNSRGRDYQMQIRVDLGRTEKHREETGLPLGCGLCTSRHPTVASISGTI
jgi:hypothetical protein